VIDAALGVTLRPAHAEDCRLLWEWRNDPDTRAASFGSEPIPFERHRAWFEEHVGSSDTRIWVVLDPAGNGIGYVRFQIRGAEAEVSVALGRNERGKGYGSKAIRAASNKMLSLGLAQKLVALVKKSNPGSRRSFERAGFCLFGTRTVAGEESWEMVYGGGPG